MKKIASIAGILCLSVIVFIACSSPKTQANNTPPVVEPSGPFTYEAYSALLKQYVDAPGMVNYKGLSADREALDTFVASLEIVSQDTYDTWSEQEQMAFWINAYNAITLQAILNHYPIQPGSLINRNLYPKNSIRQIDGVWKKNTTPVLGSPITLDDIEHKILRVKFDEPRIHVSIVCASISCPPLRNEAFVAEKLEFQLIDQSHRFVGHERNMKVDTVGKTIYLSSILDWFGGDFEGHYTISGREGKEAAVLGSVERYAPESDKVALNESEYRIKYIDYDWSLNEQPGK